MRQTKRVVNLLLLKFEHKLFISKLKYNHATLKTFVDTIYLQKLFSWNLLLNSVASSKQLDIKTASFPLNMPFKILTTSGHLSVQFEFLGAISNSYLKKLFSLLYSCRKLLLKNKSMSDF